jgi:toxin ParE1/3/4
MTSRRVIVSPAAESDIVSAFRWYEDKFIGLGVDFLAELNSTIQSICESPESRAFVIDDARLALVQRFPYVVCYVCVEDVVHIVAVYHGHRDPAGWQSRLR